MHDIEFRNTTTKHSVYTHNKAPCRPIEEKMPLIPSNLFNKTDILIMKITLNCKE